MGTPVGTDRRHADHERAKTTLTQRWVIGGVAALVVAGLAWAAWMATSQTGNAESASTTPAAPAVPTTGASPNATPVDGSEVVEPTPDQMDAGRLPALPQPAPRVAVPLPENASMQGAVVDGFPTDVVGAAPDSDIVDTSVSSDGTTMQAAMSARTDRSPSEVADHYRRTWAALGLAPATVGTDDVAYSDAYTSVSLAIRESGTGTLYTLFATLRTE